MKRATLVLIALAATAHAGPPTDRDRVHHLILLGALGVAYSGLEFTPLNDHLSPSTCRWCNPPGFDASVRNALVWDNPERAALISNLTGYFGSPIIMTGMLFATTASDRDWRRWFDDIAPIYEAAIATSLVQHGVKLLAGRQRPYAHFVGVGTQPDVEANVSFWSGHSSLTFSLAVGAATVAGMRRYRSAPAIWVTGLALAATTGYLRIAADRHYFSDVITGSVVGTSFGFLWPRFIHSHLAGDTMIVPTANGVALAGAF